ncbi:MAG: PrsW family intramembrane metalloprotease [Candidatus Peribacteria bacterium]|nr:MAG: PrsW family intramembrane metalloprotease [Candidatus Peribacteria bacterium]
MEFNTTALILLLSYLVLALFVNSIISGKISQIHQFLIHIGIFALLLSTSYWFLGNLALSSTALYYLLVAGSEEFLKYLSARKLTQSHGYASSDILVYAILVAIGFAFFENIIYLIQTINPQFHLLQQFSS